MRKNGFTIEVSVQNLRLPNGKILLYFEDEWKNHIINVKTIYVYGRKIDEIISDSSVIMLKLNM